MEYQDQITELKKSVDSLKGQVSELIVTKKILYTVGVILFAILGLGWFKFSEANKALDGYKADIQAAKSASLKQLSRSCDSTIAVYSSKLTSPIDSIFDQKIKRLSLVSENEQHVIVSPKRESHNDIKLSGDNLYSKTPIFLIAISGNTTQNHDVWYKTVRLYYKGVKL